jgi:HEAT repeat protein
VVALAHVGGQDAAELVLSKIPDPNRDVRQVAVRATGRFAQARSVRPLLDRLEAEPDLEVQEEILLALGQIGDPGAVLAIERRAEGGLFSRKPPTSLRLAAYRALAAIGTPHARTVLEDASADRDDAVRDVVQRLMERT